MILPGESRGGVFFDLLQELLMDPPRRPGAAGGTVKPWPGGSRGLLGPRPPRHLERPPAAAAPAGAVAAAGSRSVMLLWQHVQSGAQSTTGGQGAGAVKPWPGGSRGLPGPRPPRHLEWLPAAAAPAGAVAAAGGHSVVPTSPTTPPIEARCVPATCLRRACDLPTQCPA